MTGGPASKKRERKTEAVSQLRHTIFLKRIFNAWSTKQSLFANPFHGYYEPRSRNHLPGGYFEVEDRWPGKSLPCKPKLQVFLAQGVFGRASPAASRAASGEALPNVCFGTGFTCEAGPEAISGLHINLTSEAVLPNIF